MAVPYAAYADHNKGDSTLTCVPLNTYVMGWKDSVI